MISDTENTFEKFKDVILKSELYPEVSASLREVREMIKKFKANESDLNLDVNDIKRATDNVQKMSLKLFQDAAKVDSNK